MSKLGSEIARAAGSSPWGRRVGLALVVAASGMAAVWVAGRRDEVSQVRPGTGTGIEATPRDLPEPGAFPVAGAPLEGGLVRASARQPLADSPELIPVGDFDPEEGPPETVPLEYRDDPRVRPEVPAPATVPVPVPVSVPELRSTPAPTALPEFDSEPSAPAAAPSARPGESSATLPRAVAKARGTASPGLLVTLDATASAGGALKHKWVQTQGSPVVLDDPESPTPSFRVPETSQPLAFLLMVGNDRGIDSTQVIVPVETGGRSFADSSLRADAGDPQVGFVGRQITLNGIRSEPRGEIGYRWIQVGGPDVGLKIEDGFVFSFVPRVEGKYRFALVVAKGDKISEPSHVTVTVHDPGAAGESAAAVSEPGYGHGQGRDAAARAAALAPEPFAAPVAPAAAAPRASRSHTAARAAADDMQLPAGDRRALAETFQWVAANLREGLLPDYARVMTEMSRQLKTVVPEDADARALWIERFFNPLTEAMVSELAETGLDLRDPAARRAPLDPARIERLAAVFDDFAAGIRHSAR